MTCRDCIHYDVCTFHLVGDEYERCMHFKNKADFVEVKKVAEILAEQCGDYPCNLNDNAEWICINCDCKCSMDCWEKIVRHYGERKENE